MVELQLSYSRIEIQIYCQKLTQDANQALPLDGAGAASAAHPSASRLTSVVQVLGAARRIVVVSAVPDVRAPQLAAHKTLGAGLGRGGPTPTATYR